MLHTRSAHLYRAGPEARGHSARKQPLRPAGRAEIPRRRARLGHPVVIEQKFIAGDTDFTRELGIIRDSRADAIVLWTDEIPPRRY